MTSCETHEGGDATKKPEIRKASTGGAMAPDIVSWLPLLKKTSAMAAQPVRIYQNAVIFESKSLISLNLPQFSIQMRVVHQ